MIVYQRYLTHVQHGSCFNDGNVFNIVNVLKMSF